ncbi:MAG: RNA 2',3'-cyclic phosphodiesterase [Acidobacteriota bacterium]|nr:RNA 2',3'-cyclic phosphodiesterase [Acidobacteriota bacterium]
MRLFIGIPIPADLTAKLSALQRDLGSKDSGLRWSSPESWHITLQFLGHVELEQLSSLNTLLAQVHAEPVPVQMGGLGVFLRAGIFHVEINPTEKLLRLQQQVVAATARCGFASEDRPYRPHITLARAKGDQGRRHLDDLKSRAKAHRLVPSFLAPEFLLYESHLSPSGSTYEIRARYTLQ